MRVSLKSDLAAGFRVEAVHSLYAGELGHALSQVADSAERFKIQYDDDFEQEDPNRKPYTVIDGIAVYKISGPLLSNGSWFSRYLGYSAYDDIRSDLMQAAADPDVNEILLYMGTPGGSVFGVTDAVSVPSKVHTSLSPIIYVVASLFNVAERAVAVSALQYFKTFVASNVGKATS